MSEDHNIRARNFRARRGKAENRAAAPGAKRIVLPLTGLFGLMAILIGLATGSAVALALANAVKQGDSVDAGDLRVSVGQMTWEQVTPGVANGASGVLDQSPADFWSMPGDIVELRVPVTTFLQGDNLVADMTVGCDAPSSSGAEIATTFHVENSIGHQVAPASGEAPVGTPLTIHGLLGGDAGTTAQWTVVLRVEMLDDYRWVTPQSPGSPISWTVGPTHVSLSQTRSANASPSEGQ